MRGVLAGAGAGLAGSSGNWPGFNLASSNSPFAVTSKHPPLDGINFKSLICCLNCVKSLVVKLTACGS